MHSRRCRCAIKPNLNPELAALLSTTVPIGPRGSYPTPLFGRLLFKITDPDHKTRYPKKGVGYEPLGGLYRRALGEAWYILNPKSLVHG